MGPGDHAAQAWPPSNRGGRGAGRKERRLAKRIGKELSINSRQNRERLSKKNLGENLEVLNSASQPPSPNSASPNSDRDSAASQAINQSPAPDPAKRAQPNKIKAGDMAMAHRALMIQQDLLTTWVRTVRMATGTLMIKALLQQILEVCQSCGEAEQGSLFLLDEIGAVSECLLARGATIREQKRAIVGRILDDGLAAWVIEHREIGWIQDTLTDERWIVLPNQPYTVRSALCVPLQRGKRMLGLVTLTHETPEHFSADCVRLMEKVSEAIALVLENAQLYSEHTAPIEQGRDVVLPASNKNARAQSKALYITTAEGKLRYVNRRFAELFGYRRRDIAKMESILDLIPVDYQDQFVQQMQRCIEQSDMPVNCEISGQHRDGHLLRLVFYAERIHFARRPGTLGVVHVVSPPVQDGTYKTPEESDILANYEFSEVSQASGFDSEFVIDSDFGGGPPSRTSLG